MMMYERNLGYEKVARNIEIKARIESVSAVAEKANAIATEAPCTIFQDDTFFNCDNGRLKLRVFDNGSGQLIFYRRADQEGPKESFYVLSETSSPDSLREALSLAYGVTGRVRKKRLPDCPGCATTARLTDTKLLWEKPHEIMTL